MTAESRSAISVAARSSKNVAGPSARARDWRTCSNCRSNITGPGDIALSGCAIPAPVPAERSCYRCSMNELVSARPEQPPSSAVRLRENMRAVLRLILDFALPPLCPSCREPLGEGMGLCAPCWSQLSFIEPPCCARLGIPFAYDPGSGLLSLEAIANPPAYDRARAAVRYDGVARTLVQALKYGDRLDLAPMMGRWMARAGRELFVDVDALIPVPLHWRRRWARRFNQSAALAGAISALCGVPVSHAGLKRARATPQQVGRSKTERAENVQGAFIVPGEHRAEIAGRRLILVDDVLTSGATVDACTRALLRAGASHVDVLVFARVVAPARLPI